MSGWKEEPMMVWMSGTKLAIKSHKAKTTSPNMKRPQKHVSKKRVQRAIKFKSRRPSHKPCDHVTEIIVEKWIHIMMEKNMRFTKKMKHGRPYEHAK